MKYRRYNNESGMALVFAIGLLALLMLLGLVFVGNSINARKVAENNSARSQSRMFALSAVSRTAVSLMVYSHQFSKQSDDNNPPESFDHIFSIGKYNSDSGAVDNSASNLFTDYLFGKDSLMRLPYWGAGVSENEARRFNRPFEEEFWNGSWVFFTNGRSGSDRRIVGRAAWQVVGSAAEMLAPVFLRGGVRGLDLDENDPDSDPWVPRENRWGREIDEVDLDGNEMFNNVSYGDSGLNTGSLINTEEQLYAFNNDAKDTTSPSAAAVEAQAWLDKWFVPDYIDDESDEDNPTVLTPTRRVPEVYSDGVDTLLRFNISELTQWDYPNDKDWQENYGAGTNADQWYARFDISPTSSDANSEVAIKRLTDESLLYSSRGNFDYDDVKNDEYNGLPFLRRIGSTSDLTARGESGFTLENLRKQIAANFNDYCDGDGIPTSNVPAKDWLTSATQPVYTGNEKTPYIYELGMNMTLISRVDSSSKISALPVADGTGNYVINADVKAAPVLKLCNMYAFDPDEIIPGGSATDKSYSAFADGSFMQGHVNCGPLQIEMKMHKIILRGVKFTYQADDDNDAATPLVERSFTADVTLTDTAGGVQINTITALFSGSEWTAVDGTNSIKPIPFTADELENTDGTKPYPIKTTSTGEEAWWQRINHNSTSETFGFIHNFALGDFCDTTAKAWKSGAEVAIASGSTNTGNIADGLEEAGVSLEISQPSEIEILEITATKVSVKPKNMILTANAKVPGGSTYQEVGVDFVREFENAMEWTGEQQIKIIGDNSGTATHGGMIFGGIRNIDPRQNLNEKDWFAAAGVYPLLIYFNPDAAEIRQVMAYSEDTPGSGTYNPAVNTGTTGSSISANPFNASSDTFDYEASSAPGYTGKDKDKRISTAVIRNAPMMSPWEIGFIHRGLAWQTINLQSVRGFNGGNYSRSVFDPNDNNWGSDGTSYTGGDGAILEQIKMCDQISTYGKINTNMLRSNYYNSDFNRDKEIVRALFQGVVYGENPLDFIINSTRDADGKFGTPSTSGTEITSAQAVGIASVLITSREVDHGRADFLQNNDNMISAFGVIPDDKLDNDAAREEIVGKTINLLSATSSSPEIIRVLVVAQSIRDNAGVQVRLTDESSAGKFVYPGDGNSPAAADIEDGTISRECEFGRFDMLRHEDDESRNVYFDDITGEVRMFVTLHHDRQTGKISIRRIDYL